MKWLALVLTIGIALVFDACQRHAVGELKLLEPAHGETATKSGQPATGPAGGDQKP